jgi:predicted TIM-barrel enzyme
VSGAATGEEPGEADITDVRHHCRLPLLLGSGISAENLRRYYPQADGFIVGSFFKMDGRWSETVDPRRVERFMTAHRSEVTTQ